MQMMAIVLTIRLFLAVVVSVSSQVVDDAAAMIEQLIVCHHVAEHVECPSRDANVVLRVVFVGVNAVETGVGQDVASSARKAKTPACAWAYPALLLQQLYEELCGYVWVYRVSPTSIDNKVFEILGRVVVYPFSLAFATRSIVCADAISCDGVAVVATLSEIRGRQNLFACGATTNTTTHCVRSLVKEADA